VTVFPKHCRWIFESPGARRRPPGYEDVAALGSSKVGVFSTAELEPTRSCVAGPPDRADRRRADRLHSTRASGLLYVLTLRQTHLDRRYPRGADRSRRDVLPEPASLVAGRPVLYDAALTSGHGDAACASCQCSANFDGSPGPLAIPTARPSRPPGRSRSIPADRVPAILQPAQFFWATIDDTQSLRGMANHGPMHWRGDRTGGTDATLQVVLPARNPTPARSNEQAAVQEVQRRVHRAGSAQRNRLTDAQNAGVHDFILQSRSAQSDPHLDSSLHPRQQAAGTSTSAAARTAGAGPRTARTTATAATSDPRGNAEFQVRPGGREFFGPMASNNVRRRDPAVQSSRTCATCTRRSDVRVADTCSRRHHGAARLPPRAVQRHRLPGRPGPALRVSGTTAASTPCSGPRRNAFSRGDRHPAVPTSRTRRSGQPARADRHVTHPAGEPS